MDAYSSIVSECHVDLGEANNVLKSLAKQEQHRHGEQGEVDDGEKQAPRNTDPPASGSDGLDHIRITGISLNYAQDYSDRLEMEDDPLWPADLPPEKEARIGRTFQADIPSTVLDQQSETVDDKVREMLVWRPVGCGGEGGISEEEVEAYVTLAVEEHQFSKEQAYGFLAWNNYDLTSTLRSLGQFTPRHPQWSREEEALFSQGFKTYGTHFPKIKNMIPDRRLSEIVEYYYTTWKKMRRGFNLWVRKDVEEGIVAQDAASTSRSSSVSRSGDSVGSLSELTAGGEGERVVSGEGESSGESRNVSRLGNTKWDLSGSGGKCSHCGSNCYIFHTADDRSLCNVCHNYLKHRNGHLPHITHNAQLKSNPKRERKKQCPTGIVLAAEEVTRYLNDSTGSSIDKDMGDITRREEAARAQVSSLRDQISQLKGDVKAAPVHSASLNDNIRISGVWTEREKNLVRIAVYNFGKNYEVISAILGSKTPSQVKSLFETGRIGFDIDNVFELYQEKIKS